MKRRRNPSPVGWHESLQRERHMGTRLLRLTWAQGGRAYELRWMPDLLYGQFSEGRWYHYGPTYLIDPADGGFTTAGLWVDDGAIEVKLSAEQVAAFKPRDHDALVQMLARLSEIVEKPSDPPPRPRHNPVTTSAGGTVRATTYATLKRRVTGKARANVVAVHLTSQADETAVLAFEMNNGDVVGMITPHGLVGVMLAWDLGVDAITINGTAASTKTAGLPDALARFTTFTERGAAGAWKRESVENIASELMLAWIGAYGAAESGTRAEEIRDIAALTVRAFTNASANVSRYAPPLYQNDAVYFVMNAALSVLRGRRISQIRDGGAPRATFVMLDNGYDPTLFHDDRYRGSYGGYDFRPSRYTFESELSFYARAGLR